MSHQEQLSWERRYAPHAAVAAALSGILVLVGGVLSRAAIQGRPNDAVEFLKQVDDKSGPYIVAAFPQGIGTMLLAGILYYLYRATKYRREQLPGFVRYLVWAPVVAGLLAIIHQFQVVSLAHDIAPHLPLRPQDADDLVKQKSSTGAYQAVGVVATVAGLSMVVATLMISLNAMRAGLLSRFIGSIGVIAAILMILPLTDVPVVQAFWSFALAVLFLDRWPQGGRGPAWETGEADPWPTVQDRQAEIAAARADREASEEEEQERAERPVVAAGRRPAPEAEDDGLHDDGATPAPARRQAAEHPRSKKRKRKRR